MWSHLCCANSVQCGECQHRLYSSLAYTLGCSVALHPLEQGQIYNDGCKFMSVLWLSSWCHRLSAAVKRTGQLRIAGMENESTVMIRVYQKRERSPSFYLLNYHIICIVSANVCDECVHCDDFSWLNTWYCINMHLTFVVWCISRWNRKWVGNKIFFRVWLDHKK